MKCKNCSTEITFWIALKQGTPFRFKCSKCKAKYKVSTPHMLAIFIGVVLLFSMLTIGFCIGTDELGAIFSVPFFLFMVGIYLILEAWIHKYISKFGTLTRIGITDLSEQNSAVYYRVKSMKFRYFHIWWLGVILFGISLLIWITTVVLFSIEGVIDFQFNWHYTKCIYLPFFAAIVGFSFPVVCLRVLRKSPVRVWGCIFGIYLVVMLTWGIVDIRCENYQMGHVPIVVGGLMTTPYVHSLGHL